MIPWRLLMLLIPLMLVVVPAAAGDPAPPGEPEIESERVLLEIGEAKYGITDFQLYLKQINPLIDFARLPAREQQHWLDEYVRQKLLARQARAAGLEQEPEVRAQIDFFVERVLAQALQEKLIQEIAVSEEELKGYYDARAEEFRAPSRALVQHLLYRTPEKAAQARERMQAGATYGELAEEKRSDENVLLAERGWFTAESLLPALVETAFERPTGAVSELIHTGYGYHVVRVEAREDSRIKDFDSVRAEILHRLRQEKAPQLFQRLLEQARSGQRVRLHPDRLIP